MSRSRSQDEQLFADALVRAAAERAAYLDGACHGDVALRDRILALIAAHEGPESRVNRGGWCASGVFFF